MTHDREVTMKHDVSNDVLYVKLADVAICTSHPVEGDDFVIVNFDARRHVVGLQLIDVSEMTQGRWREQFNTHEVPEILFRAVDDWLSRPSAGRRSILRLREGVT